MGDVIQFKQGVGKVGTIQVASGGGPGGTSNVGHEPTIFYGKPHAESPLGSEREQEFRARFHVAIREYEAEKARQYAARHRVRSVIRQWCQWILTTAIWLSFWTWILHHH